MTAVSAADRVSGEKTAPLPFGRSHARRAVAAGAGLAAIGAAALRRAERALDRMEPVDAAHERLAPEGEARRVVVERALRAPVGHWFVRGVVGRAARRHHLELTRDLFLAAQPDTRSGCLAAMLRMDLRVGIAAIGVPTTVMVGDRDPLTPRARAEEIASAIPGARLVTVRGRGHMLPLEAPDEVASQIVAAAYG